MVGFLAAKVRPVGTAARTGVSCLVSCPANNFTLPSELLTCRRGQYDSTIKSYLRDTTLAGCGKTLRNTISAESKHYYDHENASWINVIGDQKHFFRNLLACRILEA